MLGTFILGIAAGASAPRRGASRCRRSRLPRRRAPVGRPSIRSARRSSIETPLMRVSNTMTKTGEINVRYCQPLSAGNAMIATPVHSTISPK